LNSFGNEDIFESKKKKVCSICHTENENHAKYCLRCNSSLLDIICPVCKTSNPFDQKYCIECDSVLQNRRRY